MKLHIQLLISALFIFGSVSAANQVPTYTPIENQAKLPILTPALQDRSVEKLILGNGMRVYLISDPGVDQSAAGVAVESGSWDDPKEYPGTAHFLEHMLFMGTAAYPNESEYMQYISDHGGSVNAFTASDRTVYMFSINNDFFQGAIDRFSHFFIDPLLSTHCINRELHAVDQEHAKNVEHDGWRQYMIFKETGNPEHPNCAFSTGNAQTLGGIPQEALQKWYQSHYSADQMHLVMISPLSLDAMRDLAVSCFSKAPKFPVATKQLPAQMTSQQQRGHLVFEKPVKEIKQLSLSWEIPAAFASDLDRKAPDLVAYALGLEQENSLTQLLKKEKLIEALRASSDRFSRDAVLFTIDISLTDFGLAHLDQVITHVFEAIARLKTVDFPRHLFDEIQTMAKLNYQFQSRDNAFTSITAIASEMPYENLATFPEKTHIPTKFDPAFISAFVDTLQADQCMYVVLADPSKTGVLPDTREKWMNAEYTIREIPSKRLMAWQQAQPRAEIQLPPTNPYIPKNLALAPPTTSAHDEHSPLLLADAEGCCIYYAQDARYNVPEVSLFFTFKSPLVDNSAKSQVLTDLYLYALTQNLSPTLSAATNAGLRSSGSVQRMGIQLTITGYNDKAPVLASSIFHALKSNVCAPDEFEIYRTSLQESYANASKELPVRQALEQLASLLRHTPNSYEKMKAIQSISYDEYAAFGRQLFQASYTEGFFYGNLSQSSAQELWTNLQTTLNTEAYPQKLHHKEKILILSERNGPYKIVHSTDRQGNGVVLLLQEGSFTFEKGAIQNILGTALQDDFFNTLRTRQQTAYIAKAWEGEEQRQLLQYFAVQSSTHSAPDLLARFELFLEDFDKSLEAKVSEERFEHIRAGALQLLEMPPENLSLMASKLNTLAFEYEDFAWQHKCIAALKELTYEKFCAASRQLLSRENPRRIAVLMEGVLPPENDFQYELITQDELKQVGTFVSVK